MFILYRTSVVQPCFFVRMTSLETQHPFMSTLTDLDRCIFTKGIPRMILPDSGGLQDRHAGDWASSLEKNKLAEKRKMMEKRKAEAKLGGRGWIPIR